MYVCIAVFFSSIIYIVYNQYTVSNEKRLYEELQEARNKASEALISSENEDTSTDTQKNEETVLPESEEVEETTQVIEEKTILPEYEELYAENSDLYGWIKIEDTVIDYPVMHTPDAEDPNFYISKDWNKQEARYGSIYVDGRCNEETENLIVYGHNTVDGSMFGSLTKYKNAEYYEEHKYIQFDTIYEKATYEIIAVSKAVVYYENKPEDEYLFYEHTELDSEEEFNKYISYMKENSWIDIDGTAMYGDQIITLCTCDYWTSNARLLVVAKKIK